MKYITINLRDNEIEVHNSFLGKETIKVNDKIVSNEFSIFGADHYFRITKTGVKLRVACNSFSFSLFQKLLNMP